MWARVGNPSSRSTSSVVVIRSSRMSSKKARQPPSSSPRRSETAILIALPAANGADLQVPVSIAMRGAVAEVAARFEKQTGNTVKIIAAAPSQIVASLKGGAAADVVVQIDSALPEMEDKGLVRRGRVALGTTGFGIATRSCDPAPDIAMPGPGRCVYGAVGMVPAVTVWCIKRLAYALSRTEISDV